jgi:hypothetical protein
VAYDNQTLYKYVIRSHSDLLHGIDGLINDLVMHSINLESKNISGVIYFDGMDYLMILEGIELNLKEFLFELKQSKYLSNTLLHHLTRISTRIYDLVSFKTPYQNEIIIKRPDLEKYLNKRIPQLDPVLSKLPVIQHITNKWL